MNGSLIPEKVYSTDPDGIINPADGFAEYFNSEGRPHVELGQMVGALVPDMSVALRNCATFCRAIQPPLDREQWAEYDQAFAESAPPDPNYVPDVFREES